VKILAVTDVHGAYAGVGKMIAAERPDVLIIGGDLTTNGTSGEVRAAVGGFSGQVANLFCVAGNMDSPTHDSVYVELDISLNATARVVGDVGMFGVSGAQLSPLRTPYEITEEELYSRSLRGRELLKGKELRTTIYVPHAPPVNTSLDRISSGRHVGSTAVRKFVEEFQPTLVLCGHIHEARGEDRIGGSRVVNCGPASLGYYVVVVTGDDLSVSLNRQMG
jgi:uncharacterized protein